MTSLFVLFFTLLFTLTAWGQTVDHQYVGTYNALLNGATCTDVTLGGAITAAPGKSIYLSPVNRAKSTCTWTINTNITMAITQDLVIPKGALVDIAGGVTLNACIKAGDYKVFTGNGAVVLPTGCTDSISASWWDKTVAGLTLADQAAVASNVDLKISAGTWPIISNFTLNSNHTIKRGALFNVSPGVTFTSVKCPVAGPYAIYTANENTSGTVRFSESSCPQIEATWWGPAKDCLTPVSATDELQSAINAGMGQQSDVHISGGCYSIGKLWLTYDSTGNNTAPSLGNNNGYIKVVGDGYMAFSNMITNQRGIGTVLLSNNGTGPAVQATDEGGIQQTNGVSMENMTIIANNTTQVVKFSGVPHSSYMKFVGVQQLGSGGGVLVDDAFAVTMYDTWIFGLMGGKGLHLKHTSSAGGLFFLTNVNVRDFDTCALLGDEDPPSTSNDEEILTINFVSSQVKDCRVNIDISTGVRSATFFNMHNEGSIDFGYRIRHDAQSVTIVGGNVGCSNQVPGNDACILIGDTSLTGSDRDASGIIIEGVQFNFVRSYGIRREVTANAIGVRIGPNNFDGNHASAIAIDCGGAGQHGMFLQNQRIAGTFAAVPIINCDDVELTTLDNVVRIGSLLQMADGAVIASASAVNLGCGGNSHKVTGSTTINTINTTTTCGEVIRAGTVITFWVEAGDTPTFADGAGNIQSGTNCVMDGQDVFQVMYNGTNWLKLACLNN